MDFWLGMLVAGLLCLGAVILDDKYHPRYTAAECINAYQEAGQLGSQ